MWVFYITCINNTIYDVKMQQVNDKKIIFDKTLGNLIKEIRISNKNISISLLAREYGLDRGNLSKIENGINGCSVFTLWRICEANGIKFSEFAILLETKLVKNLIADDE